MSNPGASNPGSQRAEILIADGDIGRGRRVATALEAAGHTCAVVPHGAAALEVALAERPRIVVAAADLSLVDAGKLAEILRANPNTRAVRFLFLGGDSVEGLLGGIGDARLDAMARTDQVLEAIAALLERQQRVERLDGGIATALELSGTLTELAPAELLQTLHLRGASGRLVFEPDEEGIMPDPGEVTLQEGEIHSARIGPIRGEKALFRMLAWRAGSFEFEPGAVDHEVEIKTPTRAVLAEGLRQLDEWNRLAPKLPPLASSISLRIDRGELPRIVHPLTQEVLRLLEVHDRVGDLVDDCRYPDYQVLQTLHTLGERRIVELGRARIAPSQALEPVALFNEAQCRRIRTFVQAGLARDSAAPDAKLLVVAASLLGLERFATLLKKVPGVVLAPRFERAEIEPHHLEPLARVELDGEFGIDLIHLPAEGSSAPLWAFAGHRALGTIVLLDAGVGESASRLAQITEVLRKRPGARTFHVVMLGEGERLSPKDLGENLALIDEASLFLLPVEGSKDPDALLRSLFARIVP